MLIIKAVINGMKNRTEVLPYDFGPIKAQSGEIFYQKYNQVNNDPYYIKAKIKHQQTYEKRNKK